MEMQLAEIAFYTDRNDRDSLTLADHLFNCTGIREAFIALDTAFEIKRIKRKEEKERWEKEQKESKRQEELPAEESPLVNLTTI